MSTATAEVLDYKTEIGGEQIALTAAAAAKMKELLSQAEEEVTAIRIFVTGGGCSGMTYGMTFDEGPSRYDSILAGDDYQLVVDPVALNYLEGCEIDYVKQGVNESFVFNNVFQNVGGSGSCGGCGGGGSY